MHGWLKLANGSDASVGIHVPMQARYPNYNYFEVPVAAGDLEYVEARRAGGDVTCQLVLGGIANIPFSPPPDHQGPIQALVTAPIRDNGGTNFVIPREHWLKLLADAGYGRTRLVEVPIVPVPAAEEWRDCSRLLDRATAELRAGQGKPAIATCRQVLEGLVVVVAKH